MHTFVRHKLVCVLSRLRPKGCDMKDVEVFNLSAYYEETSALKKPQNIDRHNDALRGMWTMLRCWQGRDKCRGKLEEDEVKKGYLQFH